MSRADDNAAGASPARYFVIHDTSTPALGAVDRFPDDIDTSASVNDLDRYPRGDKALAHVFVDRRGIFRVDKDFGEPWRATKRESHIIGLPAKGLFLHIEFVQPRRSDAGGIEALAPNPGFTPAQYETLAILYVVASRRAGTWLIPAFHNRVDAGIPDAHDDPQRFEITRFDAAITAALGMLR